MSWIHWGLIASVILNIVQMILHGRSTTRTKWNNGLEIDKLNNRYTDAQQKWIEEAAKLRQINEKWDKEYSLLKQQKSVSDASVTTLKATIQQYEAQSSKDTMRIIELGSELASCRKEIDQQALIITDAINKTDGMIAMVDDSEDDVMDLPVEAAPATPKELKAISKPRVRKRKH